jgi:site-specific recombinase XerD
MAKPCPAGNVKEKGKDNGKNAAGSGKAKPIGAANAEQLMRMTEQLRMKAYSPNTIRTYQQEFSCLLRLLGEHKVQYISEEQVRRYILYCIRQGISENGLHSRINALKFYFEQVLGREKFFIAIPRPKKPLQLPRFFNQAEVLAIIRSVQNTKHRVMLMVSYGAGLRVSEVVRLKTTDIDGKRMCILVKAAKGKKDRIVMLSPALLIMLREYWRQYRPSRDGYLFEGQAKGTCYSVRSLQQVLQMAKTKAGIMKPGGMHALRHSFATHLLDRGTDISLIMKLLGHNDLRTTLRYLHVTNKDILAIISPLDELDPGGLV